MRTQVSGDKQVENGESSSVHLSCPINERKLRTKIDLHVVPCLAVMYMITYLDRVNIGNAAVLGMRDDLDIVKGTKYNAALMIFFIPYVIFEIPSNIILKRLKPHIWLSFCMFGFGFVTICQGLVHNWRSLMVTRWFLGMFESGMLPGCIYLLSTWYKRSEAQKRFTFFSNSTVLAGAFGGLLATAIGKMDGICGYGGWRWVFILEGVLTCVVAIANFFLLPGFPEDCQWLDEVERDFVKEKVERDNGVIATHVKMGWREILGVFVDYKIFLGGFMFFGEAVTGYAYAFFAPTIIQTYGYSDVEAQFYSIPPWAAAYALSLFLAYLSDWYQHRYFFAVVPMFAGIAGYSILLSVKDSAHHNIQYGALFLVATSCFSSLPILVCWFSMNLGGHRRRSVGTAWQIGFGNIGGIISTYAFLEKDAPLYRNGYIVGLSFICFSFVTATLYLIALCHDNRRRELALEMGSVEPSEDEEERKGDLACTYRYSY